MSRIPPCGLVGNHLVASQDGNGAMLTMLGSQARVGHEGLHGVRFLTIALSMMANLRMQAVRATFFSLPCSRSRR